MEKIIEQGRHNIGVYLQEDGIIIEQPSTIFNRVESVFVTKTTLPALISALQEIQKEVENA